MFAVLKEEKFMTYYVITHTYGVKEIDKETLPVNPTKV